MCSAFTPDCGYDNSTIILIGDVYCPNTQCLCKFCLHKKTFQSLGRSDNQCPQCGSVCQVRNFQGQTNSSPCHLVKGFTFLKKAQNHFKMFLEMSIVLASIVPTGRNANLSVVMYQLLDPFMLVDRMEPGCLFTKFLLCYKSL